MIRSIRNVSETMYHFARARYIVPCIACVLAILVFMEIGPIGMESLERASGGIGILDMQFGYSSVTVSSMFAALEREGRLLYVSFLCLDFTFIVSYTALQTLLVSSLLRKVGIQGRWAKLNLIPFARSALDIIENCLLLFFIIRYPRMYPAWIPVASVVTMAKLALNWGYIAFVVALGVLTTVRHPVKEAQT